MFILCDVEKIQKLFLTILSIVIRYTDEEIQVNIKTTENKIDISIIFQNKCSRLLNYFKDKMDNLFYKSRFHILELHCILLREPQIHIFSVQSVSMHRYIFAPFHHNSLQFSIRE